MEKKIYQKKKKQYIEIGDDGHHQLSAALLDGGPEL